MDLPLPDGPMIARHCPRGDIEVERMQNRQRLAAALHGLADAAKPNHRVVVERASASSGSSTRHTRSATRSAPRALGWIPSAWLSAALSGNAFEEKRNQPHVVPLRERRIHGAKSRRVVGAEIRRRFHARENHRQPSLLSLLDDLREIAFELFGGQSAQPVVAAQRHHEHRRRTLAERPLETAQTASRRVARDAGVHDLVRVALASSRF